MTTTPSDEQILGALAKRGGRAMTYVVRNTLAMDYRVNVETSWVLRQLKRLERDGKVQRVSSSYIVQICWGLVA